MTTRLVLIAGIWVQPAHVVTVEADHRGDIVVTTVDGVTTQIRQTADWSLTTVVRALQVEIDRAAVESRTIVQVR